MSITRQQIEQFANIPAELKEHAQWVLWKREDRLGRMTKVPYSAFGGRASSTNSDTWADYETVVGHLRAHASLFDGIGFALSVEDEYTGVDLDHVIDPDTREIDEWVLPVLWRLHSYTEVTPSRTGLRVFVRGKLPPGGRKHGPFEIYSEGRYLTITGEMVRCGGYAPHHPANNCGPDALPIIYERTEQLAIIHREVFGLPEPEASTPRPVPGVVLLSDRDLLDHAMNAANGPAFRQLWEGNRSGYPSESESDLALCSHLLFWTGGNVAEAGRLFQLSGLMRPKWNERHAADGRTYGDLTLAKALSAMTDFYSGPTSVGSAPSGPAFMEPAGDMVEDFFRGY